MEDDFDAHFYPDVTDYSDDGYPYDYPEDYYEWRQDSDDEDEDEDCGDVSGCEPYDEEF
jgi:hypothetical protein